MNRVWIYERGQGSARLPSLGGDEYGRRTVAIPIPLGPTVVIAYWTCRCVECDEMRAETARWEAQ